MPLAIGQQVFVRNTSIRGRNKIQNAYKTDIYKVIGKRNEQDVYCIEPVTGAGMRKWVNRAEFRINPTPAIVKQPITKIKKNISSQYNPKSSEESSDENVVLVEDLGSENSDGLKENSSPDQSSENEQPIVLESEVAN